MTNIREEIFSYSKQKHKYPLPEEDIDEIIKIFEKLIDEKIKDVKKYKEHSMIIRSEVLYLFEELQQELEDKK